MSEEEDEDEEEEGKTAAPPEEKNKNTKPGLHGGNGARSLSLSLFNGEARILLRIILVLLF